MFDPEHPIVCDTSFLFLMLINLIRCVKRGLRERKLIAGATLSLPIPVWHATLLGVCSHRNDYTSYYLKTVIELNFISGPMTLFFFLPLSSSRRKELLSKSTQVVYWDASFDALRAEMCSVADHSVSGKCGPRISVVYFLFHTVWSTQSSFEITCECITVNLIGRCIHWISVNIFIWFWHASALAIRNHGDEWRVLETIGLRPRWDGLGF